MARIKGGLNAKKRHNRTLKLAKGYRGARSKQYRVAKQSVMRALTSSYAGRKQRKRQMRQLWIARINAAARMNGLSYSKFMHGLKVANIEMNRKMLAEMAVNDAEGFTALAEAAKAALEVCKAGKPILNGANASNYEEMSKLATEAGVVLGVSGANIDELHDTVEAIEKLGNKNLVLDTTEATIKETFATTVQVRRASLKDTDRTFGYPSIVNLAKIAQGDRYMQQALLSLFTMKYGSIIVLEEMGYAEALPVFGLRQNVFTDPQKPMKVEPGIYPLNGADENSICLTTVDFALTYFLVSGELERSGVPVNLVINDAGGLSVLTSWAAGKFSGNSISKFFKENVEDKVKSRKVIIPGKVAVLKGDIESKLPGWEVIVAPLEAVQLVKFMKDLQANGEL